MPVLKAAALTGLVFASAACLASLLVPARFEARTLLVVEPSRSPAPEPILLALAGTPAFADRLEIRVGGRDSAATLLPDRIVQLLEGASLRETRRAGATMVEESIVVERGTGDAEIAVTAVAGTPDGARGLSDTVAAEIAQWMRERAPPPEPDGDGRPPIETLQARVDALGERLGTIPDGDITNALRERRARSAEAADDLEGVRRLLTERGAVASRLVEDPATAGLLDALDDPDLAGRVASYRTLERSTLSLGLTLAPDSPRLAMVRLRLEEIRSDIDARASALRARVEDEKRAVEERFAAARADLAAIDREIGAAGERTRERDRLAARLAAAEARLEAAREVRDPPASEPSAVRVVAADEADAARSISPSSLIVTALAGLAGCLVGALGSGAASATRRWSRRDDEEPGPDEVPDGFDTPPDEQAALQTPVAVPAAAPPSAAAAHAEPTSLAELAAALALNPVSRLLVADAGNDRGGTPASLRLARRLAEGGSLTLLVDLSPAQGAARAIGLPKAVAGFSEVVSGTLGLSSVTVGDDDSTADLVAGGQAATNLAGAPAAVRHLDRVRGAYDHLIVDCGSLDADIIAALADRDSAMVLAAARAGSPGLNQRLQAFQRTGIASVLLLVEA